MKYSESQISKKILRGLEEMGFVDMTPIQEKVIPVLMEGKDVVGQAQTGTGKTACFGIPMVECLEEGVTGPQGMVLCPTRELAVQVSDELHKIAKYTHGVKIVPIYGGQDIEKQIRSLKGNVSIIVGTPGRVMDHMRRHTLKLGSLRMLVLDEADEMLNMGFREDIETILKDLPEDRQMMLFSATMPKEIREIASTYQHDAVYLKAEAKELTIPLIKQSFYVVKQRDKQEGLSRLIDYMRPKRALIFCNTKRMVDELTTKLKARGYSADALHGDLSQFQRDRVMGLFRNGSLQLLLATDVAARGLDVEDVDMVFNYDMPQDMEYYVHRIGRTGRAGKKGQAFSIITSRELYKIDSLRDYCKAEIVENKLPTADKVNAAKAEKTLEEALEFCGDEDLTPMMQMIYDRCAELNINPLQAAAALLRKDMGELSEETQFEKERRSRRRDNKGGSRRGSERQERRGDRGERKERGEYKERSGKKDKHSDKKERFGEKKGRPEKSSQRNRKRK